MRRTSVLLARRLMSGARHAAAASVVVLAAMVLVGASPPKIRNGACDALLRKPIQVSGQYVSVGEGYARGFVFAMLLDCGGTKEPVTVQRATGSLPVCGDDQDVDVSGEMIWSKPAIGSGHYEITNPTAVVCRTRTTLASQRAGESPPATAQIVTPAKPDSSTAADSRARTEPVSPSRTVQAQPQPRTVASSVWVGRFQDSRGAGDVTFTLVRGASLLSGTWKLRLGGGGPVTAIVEPGGRRVQLRMENVSADCPGTFEGSGELTDTTLVATYHGTDCEGGVTDGRLEVRAP